MGWREETPVRRQQRQEMKSKWTKKKKKNQAINDNGLGALQTKQLLTFVYLFLQIQRAFFASFFFIIIIISVEWKLRDVDVNALRARVFRFGYGSSDSITTGLALSAPMNESHRTRSGPARTHTRLKFSFGFDWSGMRGQKWKPQTFEQISLNFIDDSRGKNTCTISRSLHWPLATYGHITIAARQSKVVRTETHFKSKWI